MSEYLINGPAFEDQGRGPAFSAQPAPAGGSESADVGREQNEEGPTFRWEDGVVAEEEGDEGRQRLP